MFSSEFKSIVLVNIKHKREVQITPPEEEVLYHGAGGTLEQVAQRGLTDSMIL